MAKAKSQYKCSECGHIVSKWAGQCPSCKEWNTFEEVTIQTNSLTINNSYNTTNVQSLKLKDVTFKSEERTITGIQEFDRVVGGGLVNDSILALAAPPGCGKSSLCLAVCDKMVSLGKTVVYASGEESRSQIKSRADRFELEHIGDMYISDTTCLNEVIATIEKVDADFIIIDSIQTFYLMEHLPSKAGNPVQISECSSALQECAKRSKTPRCIIIISQMTKDDELAGPRNFEHLVDTVLILDGEEDSMFRILSTTKNRFGDTGEIGFFQMMETGLKEVKNPSEYFLTQRKEPVAGTSLTVLKEGTRPIVIEIESLVTKSVTSFPTRISEAMSRDKLNVLISILEQHCAMFFTDKNVIIKTQNNIKLKTSESALAILMTIASSYFNTPLPFNSVYLADVGLTGELKKIPGLESRLKELDRMGYGKVFIPTCAEIYNTFDNIEIIKCNTINDVLKHVNFEKDLVERYNNKKVQ